MDPANPIILTFLELAFIVRTFLIFWFVCHFSVKRIVKRDLNSFESKHLKDKIVRSRK